MDEKEGKKLFVGNLSWDTTSESLKKAFADAAGLKEEEIATEIVEAVVVSDRETGRSRGFGFVTFAKGEYADKALAAMNGQQLDGRDIRVDVAQDKPRDFKE